MKNNKINHEKVKRKLGMKSTLKKFLLYSGLSFNLLFNNNLISSEIKDSNINSFIDETSKLEQIFDDKNIDENLNSDGTKSDNLNGEVNIYYVHDIHNYVHASKVFIKIHDFSQKYKIDGILLEGFDYGLLNDSLAERKKNKIDIFEKELKVRIDELTQEHKKILENDDHKNILKAILFTSTLNKYNLNSDYRDYLGRIEDDPEKYSFLLDYYIKDLFRFSSMKLYDEIKLKENGEGIGMLCSPGINHLVYSFPLYGIEDFDLYKRSVTSNSYSKYNLDSLLEQEFIKESKLLNGYLKDYNQKDNSKISMDEYLLLRDKEVMKNINKLKSGNYVLIFGLLHARNLEKEAEKYSRINFHYLRDFNSD